MVIPLPFKLPDHPLLPFPPHIYLKRSWLVVTSPRPVLNSLEFLESQSREGWLKGCWLQVIWCLLRHNGFLKSKRLCKLFMNHSRFSKLKAKVSGGFTVTFHYPLVKYHSYRNTLYWQKTMTAAFFLFHILNTYTYCWDLTPPSYSA